MVVEIVEPLLGLKRKGQQLTKERKREAYELQFNEMIKSLKMYTELKVLRASHLNAIFLLQVCLKSFGEISQLIYKLQLRYDKPTIAANRRKSIFRTV